MSKSLRFQYEGWLTRHGFQAEVSLYDGHILAQVRSLQSSTENRIERLVETPSMRRLQAWHDLYRRFEWHKLAKCIAARRWVGTSQRISPLAGSGSALVQHRHDGHPRHGVLQKGSALTAAQSNMLSAITHGTGGELLRKSKLRMLDVASVIASSHHERFDGRGYPPVSLTDAITRRRASSQSATHSML